MDDRRSATRTRVLKSGKILLGKHAVPCTVRNVSETGACLEVQTTAGVPSDFILIIGNDPERTCKTIWRDHRKLGVQFKEREKSITISPVPVLVVDDSRTIRNIVANNLKDLCFTEIDLAEDGMTALDRLRDKRYGLLITDWEMPKLGGEQLLKALRQNPAGAKMPIIVITGTATRGRPWLAGANAYLEKPFSESDFQKAVETAFGSS
jgi:two-component system chemotaxis response regulator CheY